ncbi:hypothetical protein ACFY4C_37640 [Actinomadura viridis]
MAHSALTYAFSKDLPGPDVRPTPTAARTATAHAHGDEVAK